MTDVSSTIVAGEWVFKPRKAFANKNLLSNGKDWIELMDSDASDIYQVLNVWIERKAREATNDRRI